MIGDEMEPGTSSFRVDFPDFSNTILQKLNQQRQLGQLCDISIVVQGQLFRAHKAVLAASSPYFCDQVLLKNSRRVVLPNVMNPRVFENILLSTYTGRLVLPAPEIVSYLTAASFLQMWHVVDKCTQLLEGNPLVLCQKSNQSNHQSPSSSNYNCLGESCEQSAAGQSNFQSPTQKEPRDVDHEDESPKDDELSSQVTEQEYLPSNSSTEHDRLSTEMTSQDGEEGASDSTDYQYSRLIYSKPSIMSHKQWIHVKPERFDPNCEGGEVHTAYEEQQASESMNTSQTEAAVPSSGATDVSVTGSKKGEQLERRGEHFYDEQVDFYGASMEEFTNERTEGPHDPVGQDNLAAAGFGDSLEMEMGSKEETSHTGFTSVVYKLYPCQCGKSFTHKSQRDRHMSMHLGLRPYGCGICGKKFKMKHHLVGHMKIHTGIKPYECNICGKRFMWRDSFHRHVTSCSKTYQATKIEPTTTEKEVFD
ncbi:zinc finger and BTB domain-containing protein 43 [Pleurodeles waltl]